MPRLEEQVGPIRDEMATKWRDHKAPLVEYYFEQQPEFTEDEEAAVDLIYWEFILRSRYDESPPKPEEYLNRFPRYAPALSLQFEVAEAIDHVHFAGGSGEREASIANGIEDGLSQSQVLGDFRLGAEIGRGGMGIVFSAEQLSLGRQVALKVLPQLASQDERQLTRFQNEARAAASLRHPNIVPVYSVGCEQGMHFFAMEKIEGRSLEQWQREQSAPPDQETITRIVEWVIQAASALHEAHVSGIVHRDVKPGNLLIDVTDKLWVTDFGLAHFPHRSDVTDPGDRVGTPRYMSPEQARGETNWIDARTDVYCLGITLMELLTARPAFESDDRLTVLREVADREPSRPRHLNRSIPPDLETVILKAICKEPHRRYASAQEFADDLRRFRDGKTIRARRSNSLEHGWRWCRRNPVIASLLATVFFVFAVGFAGVFVQWRRARAIADEKEQLLYIAHMNLVQEAWEQADIGRMLGLLRQYRPAGRGKDLRQFEWHYWWRKANSPTKAILCETDHTVALSYASNQLFASADRTGTLKLWSAAGELVTQWSLYRRVDQVRFSPDGSVLVVCMSGGTKRGEVKLYDVDALLSGDHDPKTSFEYGNIVLTSAFANGGESIVAAGYGGRIKFWDVDDSVLPTETLEVDPRATIRSVAVSATGDFLASSEQINARNYRLRVWHRSESGWETVTVDEQGESPITRLAFSPTENMLATACEDGQITLWSCSVNDELATCSKQRTFSGHGATVNDLVFSPDGRLIASGDSSRVVLCWESATGKVTRRLKGHSGSVTAVAFAPEGGRLISAGARHINTWDLGGPQEREAVGTHYRLSETVAFSPDGRLLISGGSDGYIRLWDAESGEPVRHFRVPNREVVRSLSISPDGQRLAIGTTSGSGWQLLVCEIEPLMTVGSHEESSVLGRQECVWMVSGKSASARVRLEFSPDGSYLASAGLDRTVYLWDADHGTKVDGISEPSHAVVDIAFSPDGRDLAVAERRGRAHLWRDFAARSVESKPSQTLSLLDHFPNDGRGLLESIVYSSDGRQLHCGCIDDGVFTWSAASQQVVAWPGTRNAKAHSLALSPDGATLAIGAGRSGVELWDVATRELKCVLKGHRGAVYAVAFSKEGRTIASAGADETVRMWRGSYAVPQARR